MRRLRFASVPHRKLHRQNENARDVDRDRLPQRRRPLREVKRAAGAGEIDRADGGIETQEPHQRRYGGDIAPRWWRRRRRESASPSADRARERSPEKSI